MKPKFEAVRVTNPLPHATGWEVKYPDPEAPGWFTICETWACDGRDAKQNARRIAKLLNQSNKPNKYKA